MKGGEVWPNTAVYFLFRRCIPDLQQNILLTVEIQLEWTLVQSHRSANQLDFTFTSQSMVEIFLAKDLVGTNIGNVGGRGGRGVNVWSWFKLMCLPIVPSWLCPGITTHFTQKRHQIHLITLQLNNFRFRFGFVPENIYISSWSFLCLPEILTFLPEICWISS